MRFKKSIRILAAGILSAFVLVVSGAAGNEAAVVEAAPGSMIVTAAISGKDVNVTASATSAPASDDGMLTCSRNRFIPTRLRRTHWQAHRQEPTPHLPHR